MNGFQPNEEAKKEIKAKKSTSSNASKMAAAIVTVSIVSGGLVVTTAPATAATNLSGVSTAAVTLLNAPSAFTASAGKAQFVASWAAPTGTPSGYKLQYSTTSNFTPATTTEVIITETTQTVTGLSDGAKYYVRVAALDSGNVVGKYTASKLINTFNVASAPSGLKATAANGSSVVTWNAPTTLGGTTVTDYTLEYADNSSFTNSTSVTAAGRTKTITGLNIGTTYYYRVKANNTVGSSTASSVFSIKTFSLPDAPTGVTVVKAGAGAKISWVKPALNGGMSIYGYILQYSKNADFSEATDVPLGNVNTYTVPALTPDADYYVRVAAKTGVGTGSNAISSFHSNALPAVVNSLTATGGVNVVNLVWTAPTTNGGSPVTAYKVEYSTNSDMSGATSFLTNANTYKWTLKTTPNTHYYVRVSAKTLVGFGESTSVDATSFNTPSAVTSLALTPAIGKMTVNWAAPSANGGSTVTGYRVEYSTNADFTGSKSVNASYLLSSATISSLTPGTKYYVRVFAKSLVGEGVATDSVNASTPSAPSVPLSVTGSSTTVGSAVSMNLAWSAPASAGDYPVTGYYIRYSTDPNFVTGVKAVTSKTASLLIKYLSANTVYYVKVAAISLAGQSMSASLQVDTTVATAPSQVATPTATLNGSDIDVAWTAPNANGSAITGYLVEYADNADFAGVTSVNVTETSKTLTGLTAGSTYYVRVKAVNSVGSSTASASASATVPNATSAKVTAESLINGKSVSWMTMYGASAVWTVDSQYLVVDQWGYYYTSPGDGWMNVKVTPEQLLANGWSTSDNTTFTNQWGQIFYLDAHGNSINVNPNNMAGATYAYAVDADGKAYPLELPAAATTPTAPQSVAAVSKDSAITVSFKAPASDGLTAVSTYTLEYSKDATFATGTQTQTVPAGFNKTVELTGLDYQQKYYVRVTAVGTTGSSSPVTVEAYATDGTVNTGVNASALTVNASEGWSSWFTYNASWTEQFKMLRVYSNGNATPTVGYTYITRFASDYTWGLAGDTKADIISSAVNQNGFIQSTNANGETVLTKTEIWDWDASNGGTETGIVFKNDGSIYEYTKFLNDTAVSKDSTTYLQKANGAIYTYGAPSENFVAPVAPAVPVPSAPKIVVESLFDNEQLRIRWNNWGTSIQPITGYRVEYSTNADFSNAVVVDTTNDSYMFSNPQLGKTYYVKVYAISSAGTSVAGTGSLYLGDSRPSAPTVSVTDLTFGSATVNWTTPTENASAVTSYTVQYSTDANISASSTIAPLYGNSRVVDGLEAATKYYVRVQVANSVGTNVYSESTSFTTANATAPNAPEGFTAFISGVGFNIDTSWFAPAANGSAITGYVVEYADNVDFIGATSVSTTDTSQPLGGGLTVNTTYHVRVKAVNSAGASPYSVVSTVQTPAVATAPQNVTATVASTTSVNLAWDAPANDGRSAITSYEVAVSGGAGTVTVNGTTASITGLTAGQTYTFTVKANNNAGQSAGSTASATTLNVPAAPTAPVISTMFIAGQKRVNWTAPTNNGGSTITGYLVEYSTDSTFASNVISVESATSPKVLQGLTAGATYYIRVKAINSVGTSAASPATSVTMPTLPGSISSIDVTDNGDGTYNFNLGMPTTGGGATSFAIVISGGGTTKTYTYSMPFGQLPPDLIPGTEYTFTAYANNIVGSSVTGTSTTITTAVGRPARITVAPTVSMAGDSWADVSWNAPAYNGGAPIVNYAIQYSTDPTFNSIDIFQQNVWDGSTLGQIWELTPGATYYVRVWAENADGYGGFASPVTTLAVPAAAPAFGLTGYTFANPSFIGSAADGAVSVAAASSSWSASTPVLATWASGSLYGFVSVADANATIDKYASGGKGAIAYTVSGDNTVVHDLSSGMGAGAVWEYRYFSADPTVGAANILVLK